MTGWMRATDQDILEDEMAAQDLYVHDSLERDHDEPYEPEPEFEYDDGWSDVEADADVLASAGWGTDEDYGDFGDEL